MHQMKKKNNQIKNSKNYLNNKIELIKIQIKKTAKKIFMSEN